MPLTQGKWEVLGRPVSTPRKPPTASHPPSLRCRGRLSPAACPVTFLHHHRHHCHRLHFLLWFTACLSARRRARRAGTLAGIVPQCLDQCGHVAGAPEYSVSDLLCVVLPLTGRGPCWVCTDQALLQRLLLRCVPRLWCQQGLRPWLPGTAPRHAFPGHSAPAPLPTVTGPETQHPAQSQAQNRPGGVFAE